MSPLDPFAWIGTAIDGRFAVEALAGEGAFGVVYRGRHLGLQEPVAIKCLKVTSPLDGTSREDFVSAFRGEARLLHRLSRQSSNIVQALDVGAAESPNGTWTPYIVMEWLEGKSLEEDLAARAAAGLGPRDAVQAAALLAPAADALALAHTEGIAHRDVKPGNLFLARSRGGETLKLLDFGIAKVLAETAAGSTTLASTGNAISALTPQYAAPEQFNAHYGTTGPWTDVFALALVFIELVTGRRALGGADLIQLYVSSSDEVRRPNARASGVDLPAPVDAVLARALAVHPTDRYPDAQSFWAALAGAIEATRSAAASVGIAPTVASADADVLVVGEATLVLKPGSTPPKARSEPLSSPRSAPGEHRICTVMFVDLVGLDRLAEHLEPEDVASLTRAAVAVIADAVELHGGVIDRASSDRVMAVFGVPRAHEDDAERAVRAGLDARRGVASLPLGRRGLPRVRLAVRVGIHTGRVFAGGGASSSREALAVLGEAVNLAARIHQSAAPGSIVLSSTTHRATDGRFEVDLVPDTALEREGHLLRSVTAVASRGASPSRFDFCGLPTKTVGRTVEAARLLEILETVESEGRAQIVTLSGAAGVGKSRVLDDFERLLRARPNVAVLGGRAIARRETSELSLVRELFRDHFAIGGEDDLDTVRAKLGGGGNDPGSPSDQELWAFLSARVEQALPSSATSMAPDDAGVEARMRLRAAILAAIERIADDRVVALLCDDVQWADDASLDLCDELAAELAGRPVLVVCAARIELYERRPRWGEGRASHSRVLVERLAGRHLMELVRDRLRKVEPLTEEVVRLLCERSDGNPLILEETLLLLVDAGVLRPRDDRWELRPDALTSLVLPPTILGLVQARLDRLDPGVRRALAYAAVVGRIFWAEALADLCEDEPAEELDVGSALEVLRDRQLVRAREASSLSEQTEYVFADVAVHEVAYASLRAGVRVEQHLKVAAWLERRTAGDPMVASIAQHLDLGGDTRGAFRAHARAGTRAAQRGRHDEALGHLGRAIELHEEWRRSAAEGEPPGDDEDLRIATWQELAAVRLELGDVRRRMGRLDEAMQTYEEARAVLVRREARRNETWDARLPIRFEARIDMRLALTHKVRGESQAARQLIERAIDAATRAGAAEETAAMWSLLAGVHRREGDLAACREASLRGLRVSRHAAKDDAHRAAVSSLLVTLGAVFYSQGKLVQAERCYRQAARVLEERTQPERLSSAVCNIAAVRFALGDWSGARQSFVKSLELSERAGNLHSAAIALSNMAEVDLKLGRVDSALRSAQRGVELGERVDAKSDLPDMMRNLAEALARTGRPLEAVQTARRALALAERGGGRVYLRSVAQTLANLCIEVADVTPELAEARELGRVDLTACVTREGESAMPEAVAVLSRPRSP